MSEVDCQSVHYAEDHRFLTHRYRQGVPNPVCVGWVFEVTRINRIRCVTLIDDRKTTYGNRHRHHCHRFLRAKPCRRNQISLSRVVFFIRRNEAVLNVTTVRAI